MFKKQRNSDILYVILEIVWLKIWGKKAQMPQDIESGYEPSK